MGLMISEVEDGNCYAMSVDTLIKKYCVTFPYLAQVARERGWNLFKYQGVMYVGTEKNRLAYEHDKELGQNPFYQTS